MGCQVCEHRDRMMLRLIGEIQAYMRQREVLWRQSAIQDLDKALVDRLQEIRGRLEAVVERSGEETWPEEERHDAVTYFIQAGVDGPIKIGWTTNIGRRIRSIQPHNPEELTLLGTIPGGANEEQAWHGRFHTLRKRGEWFEPQTKLIDEIRGVVEAHIWPNSAEFDRK